MGTAWKEEDVARLLIDPFSSLTVPPALTRDHETTVSTLDWIDKNTELIHTLGPHVWLERMAGILQGRERDEVISPYRVVCIDPQFSIEHEPIVSIDMWISANAKLIPQLGSQRWLETFLTILEGGIPTASQLGSGPFPDIPFGYAPASYQPARRFSFRQVGKRQKNKRKKKN